MDRQVDMFPISDDLTHDHETEGSHVHPARLTTVEAVKTFALAGNATLTLKSLQTGTRFTYRIRLSKDGTIFFVALMNGADNERSFQYLGTIRREVYAHGRKSKIGRDAKSAKAFDWFWKSVARRHLPACVEVWHEGRCGRCNRKLTVPESIASGFGPECINRIAS